MKALRFTDGRLAVADVRQPETDGECLIRVTASGICNTDLEIVRGYAGFTGTLGHEFVGIVESADNAELIGRRVVGEINAGCGSCELCAAGDARHCRGRSVLGIHGRDGCHAEFITLPAENLVQVPDSVSDEQAVFAEPLAAAAGICEQVAIGPDTSVAVIGDGKLGLLCSFALSQYTGSLVLIGKHRSKLATADKRNIRTLTADETHELAASFDVVVEASGAESGFAAAVELVRPRGKIVLKSTFHGSPSWPASRIVVDEITIVGSRCGRFAPAVNLLANGQVNVDDLIDSEFPLSDAVAAMDRAATKGVLKVLLRP